MNLQNLLDKHQIICDINILLSMWNESHRSYHTLDHLNDIIDQINENKNSLKLTTRQYEQLLISAIFHDCIYDPMKNDNEEKSANFLMECTVNKNDSFITEINQMILDTKTHVSLSPLSEIFNNFDMDIVKRDFNQLLNWESGIYDEYKSYGELYKEGRLKFLESLLDKYPMNTDNLLKLIEYVKNKY